MRSRLTYTPRYAHIPPYVSHVSQELSTYEHLSNSDIPDRKVLYQGLFPRVLHIPAIPVKKGRTARFSSFRRFCMFLSGMFLTLGVLPGFLHCFSPLFLVYSCYSGPFLSNPGAIPGVNLLFLLKRHKPHFLLFHAVLTVSPLLLSPMGPARVFPHIYQLYSPFAPRIRENY